MKEKIIEKVEDFLELGGTKKEIAFLVISGIALLISFLRPSLLPFDASWIPIILCGVPIILEAFIALVSSFDITADLLVAIAIVAAVIIGERFAAGEVAFIMAFGELLEDLTVSKAMKGLEKLVNLSPKTARLVKGDTVEIVPAQNLVPGDVVKVLLGDLIPVDGVIVNGSGCVNQAVLTGESMPIDKKTGDKVFSGTLNQFGAFEMKAEKCGEDSSVQQMIKLVESANADKTQIVSLTSKWAAIIVFISLTVSGVTWIVTGEILRALTVLVVFCPCALVLATPTAIMASIGNVTKRGFLVRKGDALERLSKVTTAVFDKTGTLTYGQPEVTCAVSVIPNLDNERLFLLAASSEQMSEHPLGKAIVESYKKLYSKNNKIDLLPQKGFTALPGCGITAEVDGQRIVIGNEKHLKEHNIVVDKNVLKQAESHLNSGGIVVYAAIDGKVSGFLALADTVREDLSQMTEKFAKLNVSPLILTGDSEKVAQAVASKLNIKKYYAGCLPEDKQKLIKQMQENNQMVCMLGDGVNDAPALSQALVGMSLGKIGSDIAIEVADIVLIHDKIQELPHIIALSKRMMVTIKYNIIFSLVLNFLAVFLAIVAVLTPTMGALVHNLGSIFVLFNSALLVNWKEKDTSNTTLRYALF